MCKVELGEFFFKICGLFRIYELKDQYVIVLPFEYRKKVHNFHKVLFRNNDFLLNHTPNSL